MASKSRSTSRDRAPKGAVSSGLKEDDRLPTLACFYGQGLLFIEGECITPSLDKKVSLRAKDRVLEFIQLNFVDSTNRWVGLIHPKDRKTLTAAEVVEIGFGKNPFQLINLQQLNLEALASRVRALPRDLRETLAESIRQTLKDRKEKSIHFANSLIEFLTIPPHRDPTPPPVTQVEGIESGWLTGSITLSEGAQAPLILQASIDGVLHPEPIHADLPSSDPDQISSRRFAFQLTTALQDDFDHVIRLFCAITGLEVGCSPYYVGPSHLDADLSLTSDGCLRAHLRPRTAVPIRDPLEIEITINGRVMERLWPQPIWEDATPQERPIYLAIYRLPDELFDTRKHIIGLNRILPNGQRVRLEETLTIEARYRGWLDTVEFGHIAGWVVNQAAPQRPVSLDIVRNDQKIACIKASLNREDLKEGFGFDASFPPPNDVLSPTTTIGVRLRDTHINPLGRDQVLTPLETAIQSLTRLAESLKTAENSGSLEAQCDPAAYSDLWVRTQVIEPTLKALRQTRRLDTPFTIAPQSSLSSPIQREKQGIVSVMIPVYEGLEATIRCIQSVLNSGGLIPYALTVINDASPNAALTKALQELGSTHGFTLLEHKRNLGFVETVNHHLAKMAPLDVVLLNADTVVSKGWLDRLHRAAYSETNIGTVTPLSNNATLLSYPRPFQENPLPSEEEVQVLDILCASINEGVWVDLPTGVGFCLYMRRAMIDEVGLLDHRRFGKGYGEENDYCLRASQKGWRHVAACDVFVGHEGSVSFGKEKEELLKKNLETLNGLYPDYAATVARFEAWDPLAFARNRVALEVLKTKVKTPFLFITHGLGGGTERAVTELAERLVTEGQDVLILRSEKLHRWVLCSHRHRDHLVYRGQADLKVLIENLKALDIHHLHYHQTLHYPAAIWDLPESLGCAFDVTIHDYLAICPRITFLDGEGRYCGDQQWDSNACDRCIQHHGLPEGMEKPYASFGGEVENWRFGHHNRLLRARMVFAPTESAATPFQKHFSLKNLAIQPHPEYAGKSKSLKYEIPKATMGQDGVIRIAVIGAIGESKGFALLESCISDAEIRDLPLIFHIVGFTQEDESLLKFPNVRITGRYRPDQAPEVIRQTGAGIALFLSPWPETWSYTLSEALDEGLLPVSLDIGAIAERIRKAKTGHLVPLEAKGSAINDALIKIAEEGKSRGAPLLRSERDADLSVLDCYYGFKNLKSPSNGKNQTGSRKTSKALKSAKRSTGALA
jgi:GT2 family glycosyltransferase/glycosyltransferase involved in cell wall biosynthesis